MIVADWYVIDICLIFGPSNLDRFTGVPEKFLQICLGPMIIIIENNKNNDRK